MIAEIEADDALLEQTGFVDFSNSAPSPPAVPDASGPGDFSRGYETPPPSPKPKPPQPSPPPPPRPSASAQFEEGPAVKAARAAALEAVRREMQEEYDAGEAYSAGEGGGPGGGVEIDPVTGKAVPWSGAQAEYGQAGYGLGAGGGGSNPRTFAKPAPPPAPAPRPPAPPPMAPPVAVAPPPASRADAILAARATAPPAAAPVEVDAAAQQLWMLQRREWLAAESLLGRRLGGVATVAETAELRGSLAVLVLALTTLN